MTGGEDRRRRLTEISAVSRSLREEVLAPDLTEDILDRVSLHRTFLDARGRQMLWATRFAVALAALLLAAAVVFVHTHYPQTTGEPPRPTPLTTVVATAETEAVTRLEALRLQLEPAAPASASAAQARLSIGAERERPPRFVMIKGSGSAPVLARMTATDQARQPGSSAVALLEVRGSPPVPSAVAKVHQWAMTAAPPPDVPLLRAALDDTPLLFQGSLSDEVRLPR